MKKLLGLLGAASLVAVSSATVVACGPKDEWYDAGIKAVKNIIEKEEGWIYGTDWLDISLQCSKELKKIYGDELSNNLTPKEEGEKDIFLFYVATESDETKITFEINIRVSEKNSNNNKYSWKTIHSEKSVAKINAQEV